MYGKRVYLMMTCLMVFLVCAFMSGCTHKTHHVSFNENYSKNDLRVPASFIVKVVGKTTYSDEENQDAPIGKILQDKLEKRLSNMKRFSINNQSYNQYVIGIEILEFQPINRQKTLFNLFTGESKWPKIVCDVGIYSMELENNNEYIIGKKIFQFISSYDQKAVSQANRANNTVGLGDLLSELTGSVSSNHWEYIINRCINEIALTINAVFPKL